MAIGDDAVAAGMTLVPGGASANTLDTFDNETRDFVARFGIKPGTALALARGGTGAATAAGARTALGVPAATEVVKTPGPNVLVLNWDGGRYRATVDGIYVGHLAYTSDISSGSFVSKSGDTMTGHLYLPNSTAATSGFTVCYINADGRVSRGSSSQRYKKYIHDAPDLGDLFAAPLREYQMRADGLTPADPTKRIGYIAEELVGTDMERFVVVINDQVESIDFIALLLAQVAQLNARVAALEESS